MYEPVIVSSTQHNYANSTLGISEQTNNKTQQKSQLLENKGDKSEKDLWIWHGFSEVMSVTEP